MDKLTVDDREINVEKQLSDYQQLADKRNALRDRITRMEAEKASVKPHIFEKVHAEYQEQLEKLSQEIEPLEREVAKTREVIAEQIANVQNRIAGLHDRLAELKFRHRVGEYDENILKETGAPLEEEVAELETQSRALSETLSRLTLDDQEPERPAEIQVPEDTPEGSPTAEQQVLPPGHDRQTQPYPPAADDHQFDAFAPPVPEPEDEQKAGVDMSLAHRPDDLVPHDAQLKSEPAAPTETTSKPCEEDQGLVDPTEWLGEFAREETEQKACDVQGQPPGSTAFLDEIDTVSAAFTVDGDPLAELADPSAEASEDVVNETAPDASQPYGAGAGQHIPILVITKGAGTGKKLPLLPMTMTLGREHDNNIELKDTNVARYHARISFERGEYVIEDLEGSPGTWVNEKKITRTSLSPGDTIRAGGTEMRIELE